MKSITPSNEEPEKKTWVEKVTDDSNHWLLARNLEKDGILRDAARHYLKDASEQKDKNVLRAALSLSCAGRCLAQMGKNLEASHLFLKASRLYESASELFCSDRSESLWLSERISYCRGRALALRLTVRQEVKLPRGIS